MPYSSDLKAAFEKSKIMRIAIVDDAYDPIDFGAIAHTDRNKAAILLREFHEENSSDPEIARIEGAAGVTITDVVKRLDLDDEEILKSLWGLYIDSDRDSTIHDIFKALFLMQSVDRADKLKPLRTLSSILETATGVKADEFGSNTEPKDVVDYDMIFLDFYLSNDVPHNVDSGTAQTVGQESRERSIKFLENVVELAEHQGQTKTPLVMLISSQAKADDLPAFRKAAKMLASKMAFLPKTFAETNTARTQHAITGLARHRLQADALWKFLNEWKLAVNDVAENMMISLRELELTDYSYMQEYRLTGEKTPISQYVASLFSGHLNDLVEQAMHQKGALKHMAEVNLDAAVPGRVSPTRAITEIYSSLTTSKVPVAEGKFRPRAWAGDIFIDMASYNEAFGTNEKVLKAKKALPKALAVVTPACDLIPERAKDKPLQTVTMIGGDLIPLMDTHGPSTNMLMLNGKPYVINWNPKWPVTSCVDAMATETALAGRYRWVGRLRDLYHAELQHKLFASVGRVGLPVPPTLPEYVSVRILAKTGVGASKYEVVADKDSTSHSAWTFGAHNGHRAFCLRDDLPWEIADWVRKKESSIDAADFKKLQQWIEKPAWLEELQHPVMFQENSTKGKKSSNGVTYKRVARPSEENGVEENTSFVVVYALNPNASPASGMAA